MSTFAELSAHPSLVRSLDEKGYSTPTPVQAAVLAPERQGRDLLVSAQTGSGKTVAFGLSLAPTLLADAEKLPRAGAPLALVIAPTRELALQVQRELTWLYGSAGGRVASCVGGMDMRRERAALQAGAHIVVGTPGRLVDHLERGSLDLSQLKALVLDEADEMLDMGFRDELERILQDAPTERRTLLFSATIPKGIAELAAKYQRDAERVQATSPAEQHRDIEYRAHVIATREREHAIVNVLREAEVNGAIVFVSTRESVNHLHANLVERGFLAVALSGELTQPERTRALKALRDGRARVLVATDVAARGLDLPDVGLVIHGDLPHDPQVLQHRSGRTGRAGKRGTAVLLVPSGLRRAAERLLRDARVKPNWLPVPTAEAIHKLDEERIVKDAGELASDVTDEDRAVAKRLLAEKPAEELVSMFASILRSRRPEPEDLPLTLGLPPPGEEKARPVRAPRERTTSGAWFSINVGRLENADPKWLVPLLCRRGQITKAEIGAIRILPHETRVEIATHAAERFSRAARKPDRQDTNIRIFPSEAPAELPRGPRPMGPRPTGDARPTRPTRPPPRPGTAAPPERSPRPATRHTRPQRRPRTDGE